MKTKLWNAKKDLKAIEEASLYLQRGEVVAFPTETVYGLGADATNEKAIEKIFQAKGRPQDNPLIVHVATKDQMLKQIKSLPEKAEKLIDELTPGPITFILESNGTCANNVTAGLQTIGIRIPDHPLTLQLIKACNRPIAAPSANISGKPSPTTAMHVLEDLDGKIAGILDGGAAPLGMESTVIDCTYDRPIILRPGSITKEQIESIIGPVDIVQDHSSPEVVRSPGMKYKHYAPKVPLWIVRGGTEQIETVLREQKQENRIVLIGQKKTLDKVSWKQQISLGDHMGEVAANLYDVLRQIQPTAYDLILCEYFEEKGLGAAVMNRLKKASEKIL